MIPLPTQRDRDGREIMTPTPSRSRDLIFGAIDFAITLRGRIRFRASAIGAINFPPSHSRRADRSRYLRARHAQPDTPRTRDHGGARGAGS